MVSSHQPEQTAVLIPFHDLEGPLAPYRHLDPAAAFGIPPHVTLLYPFAPVAAISAKARAALGALFASLPGFECSFARTAWFGDEVLWLAPEPGSTFKDLTTEIWRLFPDCPPYGGAFAEIVPHLTIGDNSELAGRQSSVAELKRAEAAVAPLLPFSATADRALLMAGRRERGSWRTITSFQLGTRDHKPSRGAARCHTFQVTLAHAERRR